MALGGPPLLHSIFHETHSHGTWHSLVGQQVEQAESTPPAGELHMYVAKLGFLHGRWGSEHRSVHWFGWHFANCQPESNSKLVCH